MEGKMCKCGSSKVAYVYSNMKIKRWCFEFGNTQSTKVTHWVSLPASPGVEDDAD